MSCSHGRALNDNDVLNSDLFRSFGQLLLFDSCLFILIYIRSSKMNVCRLPSLDASPIFSWSHSLVRTVPNSKKTPTPRRQLSPLLADFYHFFQKANVCCPEWNPLPSIQSFWSYLGFEDHQPNL